MKPLNSFRKSKDKGRESHFSDFLLHASPQKKEEVFIDAAKLANKDQQEMVKRAKLDLNRAR